MNLKRALILAAGLAIAWLDTRPNWDDTGITAGLLLVTAAASTLLGVRLWLAVLLVAGPLLIAEHTSGAAILGGALFALAGAGLGALLRRR